MFREIGALGVSEGTSSYPTSSVVELNSIDAETVVELKNTGAELAVPTGVVPGRVVFDAGVER